MTPAFVTVIFGLALLVRSAAHFVEGAVTKALVEAVQQGIALYDRYGAYYGYGVYVATKCTA